MVDLIAIVPYYVTIVIGEKDSNVDNLLRMMRVLRLLKIDRIVPSVTLIDDVFRSKASGAPSIVQPPRVQL